MLQKKKFSAFVGGEIKTSSMTRVGIKYMMYTVKEFEKLRGAAKVNLKNELRKLRKACHEGTPNARLVVNLLDGLETARGIWVDSHM